MFKYARSFKCHTTRQSTVNKYVIWPESRIQRRPQLKYPRLKKIHKNFFIGLYYNVLN